MAHSEPYLWTQLGHYYTGSSPWRSSSGGARTDWTVRSAGCDPPELVGQLSGRSGGKGRLHRSSWCRQLPHSEFLKVLPSDRRDRAYGVFGHYAPWSVGGDCSSSRTSSSYFTSLAPGVPRSSRRSWSSWRRWDEDPKQSRSWARHQGSEQGQCGKCSWRSSWTCGGPRSRWSKARSQLHEVFGQHHACSVRRPARQEEVQWDDGPGWRDPGGRSSAEAEVKLPSCNKCSHQCHGSGSSGCSSRYSGMTCMVHHSRSDRREAPRRPSADGPARGGTLSDGWQLLVWPEIGSDHLPRSRGSSIDSEKGRKRSSAWMHFPSLPILRGAPGSVGFSLFWGSPFLGLVHEGSCQGLLLRIDRSFEFEVV